jgi:hypothetical protein
MQCKSLPTGRKKGFRENYFGNKNHAIIRKTLPHHVLCRQVIFASEQVYAKGG